MLLMMWEFCKQCADHFKETIKDLRRPQTASLRVGAVSDLVRNRKDLIIENAILRQQLVVLKRQVKRPKFTFKDRLSLVILSRLTHLWQETLYLIQPNTLLRWHRDLSRQYWKRLSKSKDRKPRISQATIDLIKDMAKKNRLWGAEKIRGELLKLGIKVSKRTVQKYMPKVHTPAGQNWTTFLKNHADVIWSCDFTVVHNLFFQPIYIFIIMAHQSRRIVHIAVTRHPTDEWTAQQLREATPWGKRPKYLIRDRDRKFGKKFSSMVDGSGIDELRTPFRAPKANAFCERLIGTLKRECLDHFLVLNQSQLKQIVDEFADYYNQHRPHQGIDQKVPTQFSQSQMSSSNGTKNKVAATPFLNGLHHSYAYDYQ